MSLVRVDDVSGPLCFSRSSSPADFVVLQCFLLLLLISAMSHEAPAALCVCT